MEALKRETDAHWQDPERDQLLQEWLLPELVPIVADYCGLRRVETDHSYGYVDADGDSQGPWVEWHPNGQKSVVGSYVNDEQDGLWTEWDDLGNKWIERHFHQGQNHGRMTIWYINGQKMSEGKWEDGELDGPCCDWYLNGRIRWTREYRLNEWVGTWIQWDEHGNKLSEHRY